MRLVQSLDTPDGNKAYAKEQMALMIAETSCAKWRRLELTENDENSDDGINNDNEEDEEY